jgi:hypothetical protein
MKAPIANFYALPGKAPDCAIGAFIGLNSQKRILKNSDLRCVSFSGPELAGKKKRG